MTATDWLGIAGGIAGIIGFAAIIGYFIYWIIDRGDPHQR